MPKIARIRYCRRCPGRQPLSECAHSQSGGDSVMSDPDVSTPPMSPLGTLSIDASTLSPTPTVVSDSVIDPVLLALAPALKPSRVRVSAKNSIHGYVEGCSRGSQPYRVRRPRGLRTPMSDVGEATKRFYRELNVIIARSERLGRETGCYILLNAQHINASGAPITFASGRLLAEAYEKTVELSSEFNRATSVLLTAKRSTLADLAKEINSLKREKEEAEKRAQAAQDELAKMRGRNSADKLMDKLLTNLDEISIDSGAEDSGCEE